jgi:hypothetical protein
MGLIDGLRVAPPIYGFYRLHGWIGNSLGWLITNPSVFQGKVVEMITD